MLKKYEVTGVLCKVDVPSTSSPRQKVVAGFRTVGDLPLNYRTVFPRAMFEKKMSNLIGAPLNLDHEMPLIFGEITRVWINGTNIEYTGVLYCTDDMETDLLEHNMGCSIEAMASPGDVDFVGDLQIFRNVDTFHAAAVFPGRESAAFAPDATVEAVKCLGEVSDADFLSFAENKQKWLIEHLRKAAKAHAA